jgi:hypothetical protein
MTAQQLHTAASLHEVGELLHHEGVPLAYGGLIFNQTPALRQHITGHFLGEALDTAVHAIGHILSTSPAVPRAIPIGEEYLAARRHFSQFTILYSDRCHLSYVKCILTDTT